MDKINFFWYPAHQPLDNFSHMEHRISNSCTWRFDNALTATVIWECPARLTLCTYARLRLSNQILFFLIFNLFILLGHL
jgi:hypothetical protein